MRPLSRAAAILAIACVAILATVPSSAQAGPIRECGNYGFLESGEGPIWTFQVISGAGTFNVTTRGVSCRRARRFVRRYRGTDSYFPKWDCREMNAYEFSDVRCTASRGRVIRWQSGA